MGLLRQFLDIQYGQRWISRCFTVHQHAGVAQGAGELFGVVLQQER